MSDQQTITVFTGTADSAMTDLANNTLATELENSGVGLYGHGNGIYWMAAHNDMQSLANQWKRNVTASGVAEFGMSYGYATGSVTITNTGTTAETINIGDSFTSTNGSTYTVLADPGQPGVSTEGVANKNGYVANDDMGYYTIAAGSSITIDVEATSLGSTSNISDSNEITTYTGSASNISVNASTSTSITTGETMDQILSYFTGGKSAPMYYLYQQYGYTPLQGDTNISGQYMSAQDAAIWKTWVNTARTNTGVLNIAPITSYNGLDFNTANNFATSTYWASTREAILYGGGVSFDFPPGFALHFTTAWYPIFSQNAQTYINFVESQIKWATSEGLRSSVIISPQSNDDSNGGLLAETKALVARLTADNALPTQFIVENYGNTSTEYSATDANSLTKVAEYLATIKTTPSNSEAGQEVVGESNVDIMMSGIKPTVTLNGYGTTTTIYDAANLYGSSTATNITMTITINTAGITLASSGGTISNNGETLTYTGSLTDISTILQHLTVTDNISSLNDGTATMSLNFTDSASNITGTTSITYQGGNSTTLSSNDDITLTKSNNTILVGQNSSLTYNGTGDLTADGTYNNLTVNSTGTNNAIAIALTGTGTLNNTAGTAGITVEENATLNLNNSSAFLMVNNGNINKTSDQSLTANGIAQSLNITGANNYLNIGLTGTGTIQAASGNIGITLENDNSNLTVENSVTYTTLLGGTVNTGDGAYVNLYSQGSDKYLFVNVNGGVITYTSNTNNTTSFYVNNGTAKLTYDTGYIADYQNMNDYSLSIINGMTNTNGIALLTHLNNINDVSIAYINGDAIISETNNNGHMVITNVANNGIALNETIGNTNYSTQTGSTTLVASVTQHMDNTQITSGTYTANNDQSVFTTNGGTATINANTNSNTSINIDVGKGGTTTINNSSTNNLTLLLSDLPSGYSITSDKTSNSTTIHASNANIILDGQYHLGYSSSVGGLNLSTITNNDTLSVVLTKS